MYDLQRFLTLSRRLQSFYTVQAKAELFTGTVRRDFMRVKSDLYR
jgi:hypothetical protein